MPYFAYGFLNGGSATSYGDKKKNQAFHPELYDLYEKDFLALSEATRGKPKGITPAFLQPGGRQGPSYMELKLRSLLLLAAEYAQQTGTPLPRGIPFFQMTSLSNHATVLEALEGYRTSPVLQPKAQSLGLPPFEGLSAPQPLITAYTHSAWGPQKEVFRPFLPLPGGHGQCFGVLKDLWEELHHRGIRYISLGNIDNIGYTLDPVELALLALKNRPAGFDGAYKTSIDVKGGIFVLEEKGGLNCADIGVGISSDEVASLEARGEKVLFNCGSGLFNLSWLLENIDSITQNLPLRFSDQSKDIGDYSQAEQITWEVIGLIDNPLIFGVDKYERFLAAKLLLENMLTCGTAWREGGFPFLDRDLAGIGQNLYGGFQNIMKTVYGLRLHREGWAPVEQGRE